MALDPSAPNIQSNPAGAIPVYITGGPGGSGGAKPYHLVSASGTNAHNIKAAPGAVFDLQAYNNSNGIAYVKLFDVAGTPNVGTDIPKATFMIPSSTNGAGFTAEFPIGKGFLVGIGIAITGGIGDTDSTGITANSVVVDLDYL